jgi:outer membrane protein assembly factor BamB
MIVIGGAERDSSGNRLPFVEAFAPSGDRLWRTPLPVMPHGISADDQGNIYVTGSGVGEDFIGGALISFDHSGKRRWQVMLESGVPAAPVVSKGWVYFVARRNDRTGLFTYDRNGTFAKFVAIDMLPDVHAQATISSDGVLLLSALELPAFLQGSGRGILELF